MAILGNDSDHASSLGDAAGRKASTKFTLATAQVLQELHAWVDPNGSNNYVIHIYTDSAGEPAARVAYTSSINANTVVPVEISQSGFTESLPAGDYWLGLTIQSATNVVRAGTGSTNRRIISSGSAFPVPADPWGTPTASSSTANPIAVWAVVSSPAVAASSTGLLLPQSVGMGLF